MPNKLIYSEINGWITSNSKQYYGVLGRITRCKGCGYEQKTILPSRYDSMLWWETHTLDFCRERKEMAHFHGS